MSALETGVGLPHGTIVTSDGSFSYEMTDADLVTFARSIRKESPADAPEICWVYAQRYVMMRKNGYDGSLKDMVTAFSQPINPAWFPTGRFCAPGGQYHGQQPCASAANRPGNASYPWSSIALDVRKAVVRFASAQMPNPIDRGVDFRARDAQHAKIVAGTSRPELEYIPIGTRNAFYTNDKTRAWPRDYVRIRYDGREIGTREPPWWLYALTVGSSAAVMAGAAGFFRRR